MLLIPSLINISTALNFCVGPCSVSSAHKLTLKHVALQDVERRGRSGNRPEHVLRALLRNEKLQQTLPITNGLPVRKVIAWWSKRTRRDSQALCAKLRAQVLHRVDTCQPIPSETPELFRQLLTSSLPPLSAASRRVKDNADEFGGNLSTGHRGGAGLALATSGQLRAGVGGSPMSPKHRVCGLLVEAKNDVGTLLWGTELPAAGLDVVFLGH